MARDPQFVLDYLTEVELLAEDVLSDKQQIVDLDKKRNYNREALSALQNKVLAPPHSAAKTWINFGGVFFKMPKDAAKRMVRKDQQELDKEIKQLRDKLVEKVDKLRDAQGNEDLKGFNLKPLTKEEMRAMKY